MDKICKVCKQYIWIKDKNDKIVFCADSFHITKSELPEEYKKS